MRDRNRSVMLDVGRIPYASGPRCRVLNRTTRGTHDSAEILKRNHIHSTVLTRIHTHFGSTWIIWNPHESDLFFCSAITQKCVVVLGASVCYSFRGLCMQHTGFRQHNCKTCCRLQHGGAGFARHCACSAV